MARKAPTRRRGLPRRNGRSSRNAATRNYGKAKPNGQLLGMYISNDEDTQNWLNETANDTVHQWAKDGLSFDELQESLDQAGKDWRDYQDYVWDWAVMYAEHLSPEDAASEMFTGGDLEDAARWMASSLQDKISYVLPIDPPYLWETLHDDMPRDEWGGEIDIPRRPFWWMDNEAAQRDAVTAWLGRVTQNSPRRNPHGKPHLARRNHTRQEHEEARPRAQRVAQIHRGRSAAMYRIGDEERGDRHKNRASFWNGVGYGHLSGSTSESKQGRGTAWPTGQDVTQEAELAHNEAAHLRRLAEKNPAKKGQWHREKLSSGRFLYYLSSGSASSGGSLALALAYKPRVSHTARIAAGEYENMHGRKVPKGTKYLLFVLEEWSAHTTLAAAKKAGSAALSQANPGVPARAKRNRPLSGRALDDYNGYLPIAQRNVAQETNDRRRAMVAGSVVHGIHPDAGVEIIREIAKSHPGIMDYARYLPIDVKYRLGNPNPAKKNKAKSSLLPLASAKKKWSGNAARARIKRYCKLKDGTLSEARLAQAFAYVPPKEDRQKVSAYKLPIADVVGGRLVAVPKGIKAAASSLDGSRGGVKLSSNAKGKARRIVNRYVAKVERANGGKK